MADNLPTVDDVPQDLKPADIEIPNDNILAAQAAYVHAAPNISAERAWAETLFARDFDVMRAAVAVLNDTGNYKIKPISYDDDVRMMDDFVRNLGDQPLTADTYNKALRATVFNQFTDPADPYDETNLRNALGVLDAVNDMRYPLDPEQLRIGQHIESKFRMSPERRMDENALKDYADASLMVQVVGDNPLAEKRSPKYQRDMQRLMMAQLACNSKMTYDPMYAYEAIKASDDQFDEDTLQYALNELAEDLPSGFDSVDIGYDDGDEPEPPSASSLVKPDDNSKNGSSDRLKQVKDMTLRVYDEPSGSDGLSLV